MRAVDIKNGAGTADDLFINPNVTTPVPQRGELLVKIKAFGLNRMDLSQRAGRYAPPPQAPKTLGVEFSGTVVSLGPDTTSFSIGDAVFGLAYGGAYAEFIAVSEKMCIHKPLSLSWEQAAGVPEVWITATQALWIVGCFKTGESVLIHAGASGVGIAAVQLARAGGAREVFVTAGSQEKVDFCVKELGATGGWVYKTQDFVAGVLEATGGRGVDVIVDPVGATHIGGDVRCAARDGRVVVLALMSGAVAKELDLAPVLYKRIRIEGTTLRSRDLEYQAALRDKVVKEALPGIEQGKLKVLVERVFDWEDIILAHKLMESNETRGKIICTID